MKRLFVILAAGLVAFGGCAAGAGSPEEQVAERQYPGLALDWKHAESPQADPSKLNPPYASWLSDDRSMFVITTFGSQGCPLTPVITAVQDERTIELHAKPDIPESGACEADYSPTTFVFSTPDGVAEEGVVEVVLTWEWDEGSTLPDGTTSGAIK